MAFRVNPVRIVNYGQTPSHVRGPVAVRAPESIERVRIGEPMPESER
jgi:hypothetical protein